MATNDIAADRALASSIQEVDAGIEEWAGSLDATEKSKLITELLTSCAEENPTDYCKRIFRADCVMVVGMVLIVPKSGLAKAEEDLVRAVVRVTHDAKAESASIESLRKTLTDLLQQPDCSFGVKRLGATFPKFDGVYAKARLALFSIAALSARADSEVTKEEQTVLNRVRSMLPESPRHPSEPVSDAVRTGDTPHIIEIGADELRRKAAEASHASLAVC